MQPETRQNLADLISAGNEIIEIGGQDGRAYLLSRRDALAIERLFEIIGEALIRIRDREPSLLDRISSALEVIGFRNVLAHGYDQIDPERVVAVINRWLPQLIDDAAAIDAE